jgi:hypothetical protein
MGACSMARSDTLATRWQHINNTCSMALSDSTFISIRRDFSFFYLFVFCLYFVLLFLIFKEKNPKP